VSAVSESPAVCELCGDTFVQTTRLRLTGMNGDTATVTITEYPHRPCPRISDPHRLLVTAPADDLKHGMTLKELRDLLDRCDMADGTVRVSVNMRGGIKRITVEES
jgi:hypothetical protein